MSIEVSFNLREGQNSPLSTLQIDENFKRIKAAFSQVLTSAGSVTSVSASVFTGLSVNVSSPTTTPNIAITTALNGFLKGNGSGFTAQASINLGSDVSAVLPVGNGGLGNNTFASNRVVVYNGVYFETSSTTTTQLSYLNNVSADIQTQLSQKKDNFTVLPYSQGGTNYAASSRQDLINNLTSSSSATTDYVLTRDSGGNAVWAANSVAGVSSLNGLTGDITLTVSNTVNPFAWSGDNLNIPSATGSVTGLLTNTDWTTFNTVTTKLSLSGGTVTGPILYAGYPSSGNELINLNYITSVLNGLKYVTSANAASTANVNLASAPSSIDGVTLSINNRVLIWQQTDAKENGVYIFNGVATPMTRATDADSSSELNALTIFVQSGTTNGNHTYTQTTPNPVIGTDNIVFVLSSTSGTYTQGTGISIVANVISLDTTYTDTLYTSKTLASANIYVGNMSNVATAVAMGGEASIDNTGSVTLANSAVIAKVLTGFTSGAGTVTASDSILSAFQKINGNVAGIVSSQWTTFGSGIYYNSGFVGMGTSSPVSTLHNAGSLSLSKGTSTGSGNYTVLSTDFLLDCSAATLLNTAVYTVPLSTVVGLGKIYVFNHPYPTTVNGGAGAGFATIQLSGSDKFNDGSGLLASIVIKYGQCITLYSNGNGTWTYWVAFSVINLTTNNYLSGVLPYSYGGTGLSALGTANQQLRVNAGATALEYFTPTSFALTNGSGTTANSTAVDLGGTLTSAATINSNTFDLTIAHSTSSRNTRFTAAGDFKIWNGVTSGEPVFWVNPSGYNSLPSLRLNPSGATFTQNGLLHLRGSGTSSNNLFYMTDSAGTLRLSLTENGILSTNRVDFTSTGSVNSNGSIQISMLGASIGAYMANITGPGSSNTTTNHSSLLINATYSPASGSAEFNGIQTAVTINQTGSSSGVVRGYYHNPTLTSVLGSHRAWENTTGDMIVGSTSGNFAVGTTSPQARAHIVQATLGNEVLRLDSIASNDDPSERTYQNKVTTTDATATTIATIAIPSSTTVMIEARVTARRTGGASGTAEDSAGYIIAAVYKNVSGTATEVGETAIFTAEDQAGWDCSVSPSSGNALIRVTGAASNNISWVITYRLYPLST